jgi:hypothetical protein
MPNITSQDKAYQQVTITPNEALSTAMTLLAAGIPLSLLLDLAMPIRSVDVYREEAGTAEWLCLAAA